MTLTQLLEQPQPADDKSLATYTAALRAPARGLWNGDLDLFDFVDAMFSAIDVGFSQAWNEGAKTCGIKPGERTEEEAAELGRLIAEQKNYVVNLGEWVIDNDRQGGGKLRTIFNRISLWPNRYNETRAVAQTMACADQKFRWDWNPDKEHCSDCRKLNGRVYRGSVWHKYGLAPGSSSLECFGTHCGCDMTPTDDPVTPGRPPGLAGPKKPRRRRR